MRIQPHSTAAPAKSGRSPHAPAMKGGTPAGAKTAGTKSAAAPPVAAPAAKVATTAQAAQAAASPEAYGGAGSLLDAHA